MSPIEREIFSIKDKLLQRDALIQYIPSKGHINLLPESEEEQRLILHSAWYKQ